MDLSVREVLARITTVSDMVRAFHDEAHCRRLLEAMVWPNGRTSRVPLGYRAGNAPNEGRRDRPSLESSCLWLIMPAYQ